MDLKQRLENVSVIGAAGKMGSGISLLLCQEMAFEQVKNPNSCYTLNLIDTRAEALKDLITYLRTQMQKVAEKQVVKLRQLYAENNDLVENGEIIDAFVNTAVSIVCPSQTMAVAAKSHMVFEAIIENEEIKASIFKELKTLCSENSYFFTNTSSIPISSLEEKTQLQGRIVGYHFYNPPAIQKLLEIISSSNTPEDLSLIALELAKLLKKKVVVSQDVAGFIGNGHFIREGIHALNEVQRLSEKYSMTKAVYLVNKATQDLLVRPMGIFQLMDYVGIDVFQKIQRIMGSYLSGENFTHDIIEQMVASSVLGGQYGDGSQKDGFFQYEKNRMAGIYDFTTQKYLSLSENAWSEKEDKELGDYPESWNAWKNLMKDKKKEEKLATYFVQLKETDTMGAKLALSYLQKSKEIALKLVADQVAASNQDVDDVLLTGFFHIYGITTV